MNNFDIEATFIIFLQQQVWLLECEASQGVGAGGEILQAARPGFLPDVFQTETNCTAEYHGSNLQDEVGPLIISIITRFTFSFIQGDNAADSANVSSECRVR